MTIISQQLNMVYLKSYKTGGTSTEIAFIRKAYEKINAYATAKDISKYGFAERKKGHFFTKWGYNTDIGSSHKIIDTGAKILLRKTGSGRPLLQHQSAEEVKHLIGEKQWKKSYKVANIRNPWDLVASDYRWIMSGRAGRSEKRAMSFPYFVQMITEEESLPTGFKRIGELLHPFIYDEQGKACDFYIRFEQIKKDLIDVGEAIGLSALNLPEEKISNKKKISYRDYYDTKTEQLVHDQFQDIIRDFDYTF